MPILSVDWLYSQSDDSIIALTGLPRSGIERLLAVCKFMNIDSVFPPPRVSLVQSQGRPKKTPSTADTVTSPPSSGPTPATSSSHASSDSSDWVKTLSWQDRVFMLLWYLKQNNTQDAVGPFFGVSQGTISNSLSLVARALEKILDGIITPTRIVAAEDRLHCFGPGTPFADVRFIADSTLVQTEKPHNGVLQHLLYSHYMPGYKFKLLAAIGPDGRVSFVSRLLPSTYSDLDAVVQSGFLDLLKPGDIVMFDKGGANMTAKFAEKQATLMMPSFVVGGYLALGELFRSKLIASARVHIERANEQAKRFRWLHGVIPQSMYDVASTMARLCFLLTHFMAPPTKTGNLFNPIS